MAQGRKDRRPSRMVLSSTVAKPSLTKQSDRNRPSRTSSDAFPGMNRTDIRPRDGPPQRAGVQGNFSSEKPRYSDKFRGPKRTTYGSDYKSRGKTEYAGRSFDKGRSTRRDGESSFSERESRYSPRSSDRGRPGRAGDDRRPSFGSERSFDSRPPRRAMSEREGESSPRSFGRDRPERRGDDRPSFGSDGSFDSRPPRRDFFERESKYPPRSVGGERSERRGDDRPSFGSGTRFNPRLPKKKGVSEREEFLQRIARREGSEPQEHSRVPERKDHTSGRAQTSANNDGEVQDALSSYANGPSYSEKLRGKRERIKQEKLSSAPVRERRGGRLRTVEPKESWSESAPVSPPYISEREQRTRPQSKQSPWAAMNQTEANLKNAPSQRSQAELKRSTLGKETRREEGGYKALKMQQALSTISYGQRTATKDRISTIESFETFQLLPSIQESISPQALKSLSDISPTPIQRLAIPALLGHQDKKRRRSAEEAPRKGLDSFLLAAETGSGKTLAYLLPTIDALKRAEAEEAASEGAKEEIAEEKKASNVFELESPPVFTPHPTTGRPRVIILVPTAELVDQVGELAKSLSHTVKFRAALISSAYSGVVVRNRLFSPSGIDLLVSTPHLLASITKSDPNILSRVSHLIIDEADSLFDRSFSELTCEILDRATPSLKQVILCSATIPKRLDSYLRERFPDMRRLATPNLHAIPRRVQLGIVDVEKDPYRGNKDLACADTIWSVGKSAAEYGEDVDEQADFARVKRIIVFVNEREKTIELADYLLSKGVDAIALNRDVDVRKQGEILAQFTSNGGDKELKAIAVQNRMLEARGKGRSLAHTKVLVVTDLASRGIDTTAVRHVILYDVPHSTIDFIHRLGRTGRMGRRGRGIVLVGKGDRRDVIKEVREGMFKGQALI